MENKGKLYLIPNQIAEGTQDRILNNQLREILPDIDIFLVENVRTARRFLSSLKIYPSIESLQFSIVDKDTDNTALPDLLAPLKNGKNIGIISEAGCPGVADPGSIAVLYAHKNHFEVVPLIGPSSILLALMASGLNGQKFAFHGYLPIDKQAAAAAIRDLEKESRSKGQTQIFIETPYRNLAVTDLLLKNLHPQTLLSIAIDLTGPSEVIRTKSVREWQSKPPEFTKIPAVFLFLA